MQFAVQEAQLFYLPFVASVCLDQEKIIMVPRYFTELQEVMG